MGCKVTKHERPEFLNVKGEGKEVVEEEDQPNGKTLDNDNEVKKKSDSESGESGKGDAPADAACDSKELMLPGQALAVPEDLFPQSEHHKKITVTGQPIKLVMCTPSSCSLAEAVESDQLQIYKTPWVRVKYKGNDGFVQQRHLPQALQIMMSGRALDKKRQSEDDTKKKSVSEREPKEPATKSQKAQSSRGGNAERYARIRLWLDRMPYPSVPCIVKESSESFELTQATLHKNTQLIRQNQEDKLTASFASPASGGGQ